MAQPTFRLVCGLIGASLLIAACTTKEQKTPSLTGPSELSTSLAIAASPDVLAQDGASQSLVTITAFDSNGQLMRNLPLHAEIAVDGSITDFGSLSARNVVTDASGRAFVTYTAPPAPAVFVDAGTIVQIRVLPAGTNFGNDTSRYATIRLTPPGVIGAPPSPFHPEFAAPAAVVGDVATFSATVTNSTGVDVTNQVASYAWSFGDGDTASGRNVNHTFGDPGNFAVSLTIVDALGRRATVTHTVAVGAGVNPTATWDFSPKPPIIDQTINFNGLASRATAGHRITDYFWTFGDGTTANGPQPTHVYHLARVYTVSLTVTDDTGRISDASSKDLDVGNGNPTADFSFNPSAPKGGQQVTFDGAASQAQGGRTIVSYSWSFGDGGSGVGQTVTHTFTTPPTVATTYNVLLTVTDSAGRTASITKPITINP